ncbi:MAG TPA: type II toxin-antitoxin system prevent-host-death family antitoxin [Solirubrobacterales bacterium]
MPKLRERPGYPSTGADRNTPNVDLVPEISQEELADDLAEILRRAEAGEEFTVTVSGKPVAQLGPTRQKQTWVDGSVLEELAKLPVDPTLKRDLEGFGRIELRDP